MTNKEATIEASDELPEVPSDPPISDPGFEDSAGFEDEASEMSPEDLLRWYGHTAHYVVGLLSGLIHDDVVYQAHQWNREGEFAATGRAVAYELLRTGIPTTEPVAHGIGSLLESGVSGEDEEEIEEIRNIVHHLLNNTSEEEIEPPYDFYPEVVTPEQETQDLIEAVRADPDVLALWQANRRPYIGAPWPPSNDVFLIETTELADPVDRVADLQDVVGSNGSFGPYIEVRRSEDWMRSYHHGVITYGQLLWSRTPQEELLLAPVFDSVVDDVPEFDSDHPVIEPEDRGEVLEYLRTAPLVFDLEPHTNDIMNPDNTDPVPDSVRTDGRWVWNESIAYYLDAYGFAPTSELLDHIRLVGTSPGPVDSGTRLRAAELVVNRLEGDEPQGGEPEGGEPAEALEEALI